MNKGSETQEVDIGPTIQNDPERMVEVVGRGWKLFKSGNRAQQVKEKVSSYLDSDRDTELVMDILLTRRKSRGKFANWERLHFTSSGLRWATPEVAADHCAERLSCERVVDLACGQGGQIIAFSKTCSEVVAIDKDPLNLAIARLNCISMGVENIELICGNSLSTGVAEKVGKADHAFCDPARPPGSPERTFSELLPDPREILKRYQERVDAFCFEVPPYMSLEKVPFECEAEYVSIDGRVNRLNLYTGELMRSPSSAVILPGGDRLSGELAGSPLPPLDPPGIGKYLHEVDPAVVKAGLTWKLGSEGKPHPVITLDGRRSLISTKYHMVSPFLKGTYRYIGSADDISALIEMLDDRGVGSVTLRWKMDPSDYWPTRNSIEPKLGGKGKVQIFKHDERFLVVEKVVKEDRKKSR